MVEFIECDTCRAKLGSPTLCAGCLNNREEILRMRVVLQELRMRLEMNGQWFTDRIDAALQGHQSFARRISAGDEPDRNSPSQP